MHSHTANTLCNFGFLTLVKDQQIVLLLAFSGSVDAVNQPLEGILLISVATTHDHEAFALRDEL